MEEVVFQEVALGVRRVDGPEVVCDNIEYAEDEHEERSGPLGFEANRDHDAGSKTDNGDKDAPNAPGALDNETKEKEDQENTSSKEEARMR